jgi:hypothetical protein
MRWRGTTVSRKRRSSGRRGSLEGRVGMISRREGLKWKLLRRKLLRMVKRRSRERRLPWVTLAARIAGILLWRKTLELPRVLMIWSRREWTVRRTAGKVLGRILHVRLKWRSLLMRRYRSGRPKMVQLRKRRAMMSHEGRTL